MLYLGIAVCNFLFYLWQCKVKRSALTYSTFGPDSPAVAGNDALHISKADACAFKFLLGMETLEYSEQPIRVFHVEPHSVIPDGEGEIISFILAPNHDLSLWESACELDRI